MTFIPSKDVANLEQIVNATATKSIQKFLAHGSQNPKMIAVTIAAEDGHALDLRVVTYKAGMNRELGPDTDGTLELTSSRSTRKFYFSVERYTNGRIYVRPSFVEGPRGGDYAWTSKHTGEVAQILRAFGLEDVNAIL